MILDFPDVPASELGEVLWSGFISARQMRKAAPWSMASASFRRRHAIMRRRFIPASTRPKSRIC